LDEVKAYKTKCASVLGHPVYSCWQIEFKVQLTENDFIVCISVSIALEIYVTGLMTTISNFVSVQKVTKKQIENLELCPLKRNLMIYISIQFLN